MEAEPSPSGAVCLRRLDLLKRLENDSQRLGRHPRACIPDCYLPPLSCLASRDGNTPRGGELDGIPQQILEDNFEFPSICGQDRQLRLNLPVKAECGLLLHALRL